MAVDFAYRKRQVAQLSTAIGVYVLADLDNVPIYVGLTTDSIRARVQRHLTSARSDIVANRQIDVWEIAFVHQYPVKGAADLAPLESALYHAFDPVSRLMNGTVPALPPPGFAVPPPGAVIPVMPEDERRERLDPEQRLPRQVRHYGEIVGHFQSVKNSPEMIRAMDAHFERLARYHARMQTAGEDHDQGCLKLE